MLTQAQESKIISIARQFDFEEVAFKLNGLICLYDKQPIREKAQKAFPNFEFVDSGCSPYMEERTDDQRELYWVWMRPDVFE